MSDTRKAASEAQIAYLVGLTTPERLADLSSSEARTLIAWLRGVPNISRAQQSYLLGMMLQLSKPQVVELIGHLRGIVAPVATAARVP